MCGVALANASVPPAMVVGCMAIHLCKQQPLHSVHIFRSRSKGKKSNEGLGGDRFTDRREQERLIQVLTRTDALHGWPTHALQHQLRETWGMTGMT